MASKPLLAPPPGESDVPDLNSWLGEDFFGAQVREMRQTGASPEEFPGQDFAGHGRPHAPNGFPDAALRGQVRDRTLLQFPRLHSFPAPPQPQDHNDELDELWVCKQCRSTDYGGTVGVTTGSVLRCGSAELYDANRPAMLEKEQGVWTYRPHGSGASASPSPQSSVSSASCI